MADIDCVFSLMIRSLIKNIQTTTIKLVRESILTNLINILHAYRLNVATILNIPHFFYHFLITNSVEDKPQLDN